MFEGLFDSLISLAIFLCIFGAITGIWPRDLLDKFTSRSTDDDLKELLEDVDSRLKKIEEQSELKSD